MQNRYTGDIGDYVKLAILRALMPGRRLGVGWWLYPDESHNGDGRHIDYLAYPEIWRRLDPPLFDYLKAVVSAGERKVTALEHEELLPEAVYFREPVPSGGTMTDRRAARIAWLGRLCTALEPCDFVFLDPDNGFETKGFDLGAAKAGKSIAVSELQSLHRPWRVLLSYHHQTRMRGGHDLELEHWGARLRAAGFGQVDALRAAAFSARAFFLLEGTPELRAHAAALSMRWGGQRLSWRPDVGLSVPAAAKKRKEDEDRRLLQDDARRADERKKRADAERSARYEANHPKTPK
jgi:hypothetical protein